MERVNELQRKLHGNGLSDEDLQGMIDFMLSNNEVLLEVTNLLAQRSYPSLDLPDTVSQEALLRLLSRVFGMHRWPCGDDALLECFGGETYEQVFNRYSEPSNLVAWMAILTDRDKSVLIAHCGLNGPVRVRREIEAELHISHTRLGHIEQRASHQLQRAHVRQVLLDSPTPVLDSPIQILDISERAMNTLLRHGYFKVHEVTTETTGFLTGLNTSVHSKSVVSELAAALGSHGLTLHGS